MVSKGGIENMGNYANYWRVIFPFPRCQYLLKALVFQV